MNRFYIDTCAYLVNKKDDNAQNELNYILKVIKGVIG